MDEDFIMPLEIKIGTCDSTSRVSGTEEEILIREEVTPEGVVWDSPPDSEEGTTIL